SDDGAFTKHENDDAIPLYDESQLADEYARLAATRANRPTTKASDKSSTASSKDQQPQTNSASTEKARLDKYYGDPSMRQTLFADYQSLQTLAEKFRGRRYDLQNPDDRQTMKIVMLSSLRPEALKVLRKVAADYRRQYDRPLPVSSLVRPDEYQHTLRRFNRAATTIETPPHSTGLAFDIDYRYMSIAEQNFVMAELARLKDAGLIEVLRERYANFHVFVFTDGVRPSDDLIAASLEEAGAPPANENDNKPSAEKKPATNDKKSSKPEKPRKTAEKSQRRVKRR
ncbi:MAG TPA: DUF5715 family protein, partial [Pyrinomonadaceae bacterium]|nr:DUF5715 family protein [Pyrinomonadaceae bacterium]